MSENNGSAWPNQGGSGANGPFSSQTGDSSAWNGYGQQQQQYPNPNGAPYNQGQYGQGQYGQPQYGSGGPYGPGGSGPMGGPQKRFPWVPVIIGLVAVIAIVIGVLFATGVVGGSDDAEPTPTPSVTIAPQPTTAAPTTEAPSPTPDATTPGTTSNTNGQNADGSVNVGQWKVEFIEFQKDGADQVAKTGEEDVKPLKDGFQWAAAKVKLTNMGDTTASPSEVGITLNTDTNEEVWEELSGFHGDESVRGLEDLQPGDSAESWYYLQIPSDMESAGVRFFDYTVPENVDTDITVK